MIFLHFYIFLAEKECAHRTSLADAEGFDLGGDGCGLCGNSLLCLSLKLSLDDGPVVVVLSLDLPLGLQGLDDVLVLPSDIVAQPSQRTELPSWLEAENLECGWDDHLLLLVVWGRDTLEGLEPLHGLLALLGLVWHHSSHRAPEDLGGSAEVERASGGLDVATQPQELQVLELVPVEVSAHVDALAPHDHDLVADQNVLGDDGGQTAHQVAAAINHHRLR